MRVIVTGSRKWSDDRAVNRALERVFDESGPFLLVHGACSTGADHYARVWVGLAGSLLGCKEERWPAHWGRLGKAAGPERNRRMIEAGADLVLAFPLPEGSGTQHTIGLAREAGIEVRVIE
ncbi:SLOG family protein [Streptomyces paludis]|uniref:DUF2493 domain-containing protein n=1 Tax=Streptomyces paludis TaxID=2282738 RepID=A0A345HWQ5_9ACTN|nr:SLOG family protein [Streptomyces paludis]AXG81129.1 DUF2493 domain-containing protein [Streptomyces paludis]